jgi:hypothetical protein
MGISCFALSVNSMTYAWQNWHVWQPLGDHCVGQCSAVWRASLSRDQKMSAANQANLFRVVGQDTFLVGAVDGLSDDREQQQRSICEPALWHLQRADSSMVAYRDGSLAITLNRTPKLIVLARPNPEHPYRASDFVHWHIAPCCTAAQFRSQTRRSGHSASPADYAEFMSTRPRPPRMWKDI